MASIEIKVRKLDGELARYKEQMAKLRNGPGKVSAAQSLCISLSYHLLLASRANFALSITLPLELLSFVLSPHPRMRSNNAPCAH